MKFDFLYTGHFYQWSTALYLAPYRAYNSQLGRWLNRDPIGMAGGMNLYGYVGGNPLNGLDPLGLLTASDTADSIGSGIDGFFGNTGSFIGDYLLYGFTEGIKLPFDVLRLGQGTAYCYEGYDSRGPLSPLGRALQGAADVGRAGALAGGITAGGKAMLPATDFFEGTRYTSKVLGEYDMYHNFPESVTGFQDAGKISKFKGGDGRMYEKLEIQGSYGDNSGIFEFIKDSNGNINHRVFNRD